jgi:hypothetical protein
MIPGLGFMALRRAERAAAFRRRLLAWGLSMSAAMAFLVACGLLDRMG